MAATYEDMRELLDSPEFVDAWRRVNAEPVSFVQFEQMPMPTGFTAQGLWETTSALRRHAGTTLPFPPYFSTSGATAWFSLPAASQTELATLVAQAREDSSISTALTRLASAQSTLKPLLTDEVFSLTRRDGLRLTRETIRSLWLQTRAAHSPAELLVTNLSHVYDESEALASRHITRGLIEDIHERICAGINDELPNTQPRFPLKGRGPYEDPDFTLGVVRRLSTDAESKALHPVFAAINMSAMFWDLTPFESGNALTEFIVRRIHSLRCGLAALAYTSFSHTMQRWEEGRPSFDAGFALDEITADSSEGLDATVYHAVCVRALLYELEKLKGALDDIASGEATRLHALDTHTRLNPRQKDVLMRALRDPDVRFTLDAHHRTYGVVYATGRTDLLELVEMGFLAYYKEGRRFVFQAVPHLAELLDALG